VGVGQEQVGLLLELPLHLEDHLHGGLADGLWAGGVEWGGVGVRVFVKSGERERKRVRRRKEGRETIRKIILRSTENQPEHKSIDRRTFMVMAENQNGKLAPMRRNAKVRGWRISTWEMAPLEAYRMRTTNAP
jgi:hypothetical protein